MIGGLSSILPALGQISPYADEETMNNRKRASAMLKGPARKEMPAVLPPSGSDQRPIASPAMTGMPAVPAPAVEQVAPRLSMDRTGVPLPTFMGEIGGPREWSPMEQQRYDDTSAYVNKLPGAGATDEIGKAKFEHMMKGVKRDNMNRVMPGMEGMGWKGILGNALRGFAQAASANPNNPLGAGLGGAATAGILSGVSPTQGREYQFEQGEQPRLEREMQRRRQLEKEAYDDKMRDLNIQNAQVGIEGQEARTKATIAGMKDADLLRRKGEAEIGLIQARQKAIETGKPTYQEIEGNDGVIRTYQVFPDGSMAEVGRSGRAAMASQANTSREGIARDNRLSREGMNQANINSRERMGQATIQSREGIAAANRESRERTAASQGNRLGGGGPLSNQAKKFSVSRAAVEAFAKEKGISPEEAAKRFQNKGYSIK